MTVFAAEHGKIFRTVQDVSVSTTIVCLIISILYLRVCGSLGYVVASTVLRAWSSLAYQFSLTVSVKVVNHKLCIVRTSANVLTQ